MSNSSSRTMNSGDMTSSCQKVFSIHGFLFDPKLINSSIDSDHGGSCSNKVKT